MKKLLILAAMAGAVAIADPLCTNTTLVSTTTANNGTIIQAAGVFGGSNGCVLNGVDFSNFEITPTAGFTNNNTGVLTVNFNLAAGGFWFGITQGGGQDVFITFTETPGNGFQFLSLNIPGGGTGLGSVNETICTISGSGFSSTCGSVLGGDFVSDVNGNNKVSTLITYAPQPNGVFISKDINGTSEVFQLVAPEPMSLSMMGLGLLGLGFLGRKAARK